VTRKERRPGVVRGRILHHRTQADCATAAHVHGLGVPGQAGRPSRPCDPFPGPPRPCAHPAGQRLPPAPSASGIPAVRPTPDPRPTPRVRQGPALGRMARHGAEFSRRAHPGRLSAALRTAASVGRQRRQPHAAHPRPDENAACQHRWHAGRFRPPAWPPAHARLEAVCEREASPLRVGCHHRPGLPVPAPGRAGQPSPCRPQGPQPAALVAPHARNHSLTESCTGRPAPNGPKRQAQVPLAAHRQLRPAGNRLPPGIDVFYHQDSGTAFQATPRGRHRIRAEVGFELAIE
jgi:hypothetical protein